MLKFRRVAFSLNPHLTLRRFSCSRFTAFKVFVFFIFGGLRGLVGVSLAVRGGLVAPRRAFWVSLGVSGRLFGMFLGSRVASCAPPGGHWGSPGASWGSPVGRWPSLWVSGCPLVFSWVSLWACRRVPGRLLGVSGRSLGTFMPGLLQLPPPPLEPHLFPYQIRIISVISRPRRLEGQIPSFGRPVETHHFLYQNRIISVISRPRRLQGQIPSFGRPV